MYNVNRALAAFFAIVISSCSLKQDIAGRYSSKEAPYGFDINKDSTFSYRYYEYHTFINSSGRWVRKGNSLLLNSSLKDKIVYFKNVNVDSRTSSKNNYLTVNFDKSGVASKDCKCGIIIDSIMVRNIKCDSIKMLKIDSSINNLQLVIDKWQNDSGTNFPADYLETDVLTLDKKFGNDINVTINVIDSLFSYEIIENMSLKIKNDKLIYTKSKKKFHLYKKND